MGLWIFWEWAETTIPSNIFIIQEVEDPMMAEMGCSEVAIKYQKQCSWR